MGNCLKVYCLVLSLAVIACSEGDQDHKGDQQEDAFAEFLSTVPHSSVDFDDVETDTAYFEREIGGIDEASESKETLFLGRPTSFVKLGDSLYICDRANNCIVVAHKDGRLVRRIGRDGAGPLEFRYPAQIVTDGNNVLIYDLNNARVQLLSKEFKYIKSFVASFPPTGPSIALSKESIILRGNMGERDCIRVFDLVEPDSSKREFLPFGQDYMNLKLALRDSVLAVAYVTVPAVMLFSLDGTLLHVIDVSGEILREILRLNKEWRLNNRTSRVKRETFIFGSMHWLKDGSLALNCMNSICIVKRIKNEWRLVKRYVCVSKDEAVRSSVLIISDFHVEEETIYTCGVSIAVFRMSEPSPVNRITKRTR